MAFWTRGRTELIYAEKNPLMSSSFSISSRLVLTFRSFIQSMNEENAIWLMFPLNPNFQVEYVERSRGTFKGISSRETRFMALAKEIHRCYRNVNSLMTQNFVTRLNWGLFLLFRKSSKTLVDHESWSVDIQKDCLVLYRCKRSSLWSEILWSNTERNIN